MKTTGSYSKKNMKILCMAAVLLFPHASGFVGVRNGHEPCRSFRIPYARDRLKEALDDLSEAERYNTVLQGMLQRRSALTVEAWPLLEEMAGSGEKISAKTRAAVVDAAAGLENAAAMERTLQLIKRTGRGRAGASKYACEMVAGAQLPPTDRRRRQELKVRSAETRALSVSPMATSGFQVSNVCGTEQCDVLRVRHQNRLPEIPDDNRIIEVGSAATALVLASLSATWPVAAPLLNLGDPDSLNVAAAGSALLAVGVAADTFALEGSVGLGSTLSVGFIRLFSRDTEREVCGLFCFSRLHFDHA